MKSVWLNRFLFVLGIWLLTNHSFAQTKMQMLNNKLFRGSFYYDKQDFSKAKGEFEEALQIDSNYAPAYEYLGLIYTNLEQNDSALIFFKKLLTLIPGQVNCYLYVGKAYDQLELFDSAIFYYTIAINMDAGCADCWQARGFTYLKMGKYNESLSDVNTGIEYDSLDCYSRNCRGLANFYLGNYIEAMKDYHKSLTLNYKNEYTYFIYNNMGNCYLAMKKMDEACRYWKLAIESGYVYLEEYKRHYNFEDPKDLLKKYCP